ncbi:hypothetical protein Gohar_022326, partial [Gossypium harknessii]|nr:hypothetical protein [Gossypium harknessii]
GYLRCERGEETAIDTLKDCPKAHVILAFGGLDGRILDNTYERCIDWLEDTLRWNCCNNAIFCGKNEEARVVWERSKMLGEDFRIHNLSNNPILPLSHNPQKLEKPPIGFMKVNVDATICNNKSSFGVIIHDCDGFNFDRVIFESNYASIINRLYKHRDDITILGHRIDEVKSMIDLFAEAEVRWISRNKNKVVDKLYSLAMKNSCNLSFELEYPSDIHQLVILDSF